MSTLSPTSFSPKTPSESSVMTPGLIIFFIILCCCFCLSCFIMSSASITGASYEEKDRLLNLEKPQN